jgi:signal transduction histidine kinase
MFQYNDLYQYYNPTEKNLSSDQIRRITLQADHDLASRGFFGIFVLPVIYTISAIILPYASEHPQFFWAFGILIFGSSLARFFAALELKKNTHSENRLNWQKAYLFSSLTNGLGWGLFSASSLYFYTSQSPNIFVLFFLAAVAGWAVASFSTWLYLNQAYLVALLLPTILICIPLWNQEVRLVGILAAIAAIYNFALAKKLNTSYWQSLINTYLLENEIIERREAEHAAEKANNMKTEFLANMSHEMRTPLHGILGYAKFGQDRSESISREKLKNYFSEITANGDRLFILVNDLLDLAKLDSDKMQYDFREFDLSNTIARVILELASLAEEKQIEIRQTPETSTTAVFDRNRISQVFQNLLINAIKFSPSGAVITIRCRETRVNDKEGLLVMVQDQGVGIPAEEQEHIFEKFVQSSKTKSGAGGTGLGLSISKKIVEDHGGQIRADNNPDRGTTFSFTLPRAPDIQNSH